MRYRLEKLVMHNFKLFAHAEIEMESMNLVMLDGPNGYGKTSTFDALEYLFTGNVRRVSENGISKSNIGFDEDCMIKNPSDGTETYVKGVLCTEKEQLEIIRKLYKGKGAENNPSKIEDRTHTTVTINGDVICNDETVSNANKEITRCIGENILSYYNQFYYIAQEDRLRFLSRSENERSSEIQKLFGIEEEEQNYQKIEKCLKLLKNLDKKHSKELESKKQVVEKMKEEMEGKGNDSHIDYKDLIENSACSPVWNQEHPVIENQEKLKEVKRRIQSAGMFSREIELYKKDIKNSWIEDRIKDNERLKQYLYLNAFIDDLEGLKAEMQKYYNIEKLLKQAELENGDYDYEQYDYEQLKEYLNLELDLEQVLQAKNDIKNYRKNIKEEDGARDSIVKLQKRIKEEWETWQKKGYEGLSDSKCPLCGNPYKDSLEVIEKLDTYRQVIERGKGDFQRLIDQKINVLKEIYDLYCKEEIKKYLGQNTCYENHICRRIYEDWEPIVRDYRKFYDNCINYEVPIDCMIGKEQLGKADEIVGQFTDILKEHKSMLPDEYYSNRDKYQYKDVLTLDYNDQQDSVKYISEEDEHKKLFYIEQEYYGKVKKTLSAQEKELEQIGKRVEKIVASEKNLKELRDKVKDELRIYREKLVSQLKIPFYLYTGRILQNYQGGLGIWMNTIGGEKIRFEAEGRKGHDILYTLSSGQLSAVTIAIALTLNKIYAQDRIRCMFIDDPIQTMDELNIASFCEVLRTDFKEYQFILSTHEENFSDYIRYKYEKYGLGNRSVNVWDL
ncbi:MAG: AAA family ATPase [Roseburia sp.]|nr:AAA family ATPase [Roseburia sp.]MCM1278240.1 AAA family ATPase [Robinsoniella sp.]